MYSKISRLKFLIKLISLTSAISTVVSTVYPMSSDKRSHVGIGFSDRIILQKLRDADTVILDKPGNYMLVSEKVFNEDSDKKNSVKKDSGKDKQDCKTNDQTTLPIKGFNRIFIKGGGVYNIVMKNVNIKPKCYDYIDMQSPFSNDTNAEINITLIGKNMISGSCMGEIGLSINGSLTITDKSTGCLDVMSDGDCAIYANNITIKNGNIKTSSELIGIYGLYVDIEGGKVVASSSTIGIYGVNKLKLVHCNIKTSSVDALYPETLPGLTSNSDVEIVDGIVNGVKY